MKSLKSISVLALLFSMALFAWSCGGNSGHSHDGDSGHDATQTEAAHEGHDHDAAHSEAHHGEGKEYTSAYVCPMHCEGSGSEEPGNCPVCGMDYVAQAEHVKDGHSH
ncbi:MAG: hypothetical protein H6557_23205 [Lewinellaceae bacterium]|nr:hypothetical protein [Phaeodactylibacter sp.]MCB9039536.1 hypothetical protein [Lewinellaceae bacterium]